MTTLTILDKARPFSDLNIQFGLNANSQLSFTVPGDLSDYFVCEFSWNRNLSIWVGFNIDVSLPSSGTISQENRIEQNPFYKFARGGDVLNFESDQDISDANVNFYILNSNKFFPVPSPPPIPSNAMLYADGSPMLYADGSFMLYAGD